MLRSNNVYAMGSRRVHPVKVGREDGMSPKYNTLFSNDDVDVSNFTNPVGRHVRIGNFRENDEIIDFGISNSNRGNSNRKVPAATDLDILESDNEDVFFGKSEPVAFGVDQPVAMNNSTFQDEIDGLMEKVLNSENSTSQDEVTKDDDDDENVDFTGLGDHAVGALGSSLFANPEVEENIKKLVDIIKKYKVRVHDLRNRNSKIDEEKRKLKKERDALEEEKAEVEIKAERQIRMLQYKTMGNRGGNNQAEAQRRRDAARRQMYSGNDGDEENDDDIFGLDSTGDKLGIFAVLLKSINKWVRKHQLLQSDLRRIDARFGSSVASYFYFFKWIILNYCLLAIVCIGFLCKHILNLISYQSLSEEQKQAIYNTANEPFTYYNWQSRHWSEVSLFLPKFFLSSSYNPGDSSTLYVKDESTTVSVPLYLPNGTIASLHAYDREANLGERLDYVELVLLVNLLFLIFIGHKWVIEDRKAKNFEMIDEVQNETKYSKLALNLWDHSLKKPKEIEDLKYSTLEAFIVNLHEDATSDLTASYTFEQKAILVLRRVTAFFLYLGFQVGSAFVIVYMTASSTELRAILLRELQGGGSFNELLAGSIVPLTVSVLNGLLPTIITMLTNMEKWENAGTKLKWQLGKLFVAKNLNVLIQIFSFVQLLDPILLRGENKSPGTRTSTEKRFQVRGYNFAGPLASRTVTGNGYPVGLDECRADWYGVGIFQLVVTEFVVSKTVIVLEPTVMKLLNKLTKKPFVKKEFDVAKQMVSLLFFQQLCFMSFPFCPFGTIFICGMTFASFKIDKYALEHFMSKPKKPWSAKDAAGFFVKFFFLSYSLSLAITAFILRNDTFPKACPLQSKIASFYSSSIGTDPFDDLTKPRTLEDIVDNNEQDIGLEEYRFWEEYLYYVKGYNATTHPNITIPVSEELRNLTGYTSEDAVGDSSLYICTFSCGPFIFNTTPYQPIDRILQTRFNVAYELVARNTPFVWSLCIVLLLLNFFKNNRIIALQATQQEKDIVMRDIVATLELKVKKLTERVQKLKQTQ